MTETNEEMIPALLLRRYNALLSRSRYSEITGKALNVAIIVAMCLTVPMYTYQAIAFFGAAALICAGWQLDKIVTAIRLKNLEEHLVKRAGGEWEDFYIETRYNPYISSSIFLRSLRRIEPALWFILIALITALALLHSQILAARINQLP